MYIKSKLFNLALGIVLIGGAFSFNEVQAQSETDTISGTGIIQAINNENEEFVPDVNIYLRAENMSMVVPTTIYQYTTDNNGGAPFNVPVYIDSTTGIRDLIENKPTIIPTFGSEMNAFFPKIETGTIELYNMLGEKVRQQKFKTDHEYLEFNDLAAGMYSYTIQTESGIALGGKFMKMNTSPKGPAKKPAPKLENNVNSTKDFEFYTATYWAKLVHPDYYTDSTLITLNEGDNGPINLEMTPIPPIVYTQDIAGIVTDMNNNYSLIEGAIIKIEVPSTGDTYTATTNSDGSFIVENFPLGVDLTFNVGGKPGKYAFTNINYTTIDEIDLNNLNDTINDNFNVVLPDKVATTTAFHIRDQTINGTNQDTIFFYQGNSFSENQKNNNRNNFITLQAEENNSYIFIEKFTASNIGINMEFGTYNTQSYDEDVYTPLGQILYPVYRANTTLPGGNGGYIVNFTHEIKRAIGFAEVGWPNAQSVMECPTNDYTQEDKDIAEKVERPYWNSVYNDEKTWIDLNNIAEDLNDKSPGL